MDLEQLLRIRDEDEYLVDGIPFSSSINSPNGADFVLRPYHGTTTEAVSRAKRILRVTRDVTGITVVFQDGGA